MIVETALKIAGPGAVLAARPAGVAHVYGPGPLTPSGRFVPRAGRPVCRARTRRLGVVAMPPTWSSLSHPGALPRLCARCSACLARRLRTHPTPPCGGAVSQARQAEPLTRDSYRTRFADLTLFDLWLAGMTAETPAELDVVGHLALVLFGYQKGAADPVTRPDGRTVTSLHEVLARRRHELTPDTDTLADEQAAREAVAAVRRARATEHRELRDLQRAATRATIPPTPGAPL